jgi:hypothetical protein
MEYMTGKHNMVQRRDVEVIMKHENVYFEENIKRR